MTERTKLWIAEKMKELMKKKPLDKIRITEICQAAGIERSTFYYHFKDKYDLVAWIFFYSAENIDVTDVSSAAAHMQQLKEDYLFYKRAYEDPSPNSLWPYMFEYYVKEYTAVARKQLHTEILDPELSFSIRLYCYGASGMAKEWILQEHAAPAETVIRMMFASMPRSMKAICFPDSD